MVEEEVLKWKGRIISELTVASWLERRGS